VLRVVREPRLEASSVDRRVEGRLPKRQHLVVELHRHEGCLGGLGPIGKLRRPLPASTSDDNAIDAGRTESDLLTLYEAPKEEVQFALVARARELALTPITDLDVLPRCRTAKNQRHQEQIGLLVGSGVRELRHDRLDVLSILCLIPWEQGQRLAFW
jgi:hypothetical protein